MYTIIGTVVNQNPKQSSSVNNEKNKKLKLNFYFKKNQEKCKKKNKAILILYFFSNFLDLIKKCIYICILEE